MGECSGREDRRFEKHAKNVEAGAADGPDGTRMLRHRSRSRETNARISKSTPGGSDGTRLVQPRDARRSTDASGWSLYRGTGCRRTHRLSSAVFKLPPAGSRGPGRGAAAPPVGITVEGEVKNYVPVTDAMLRSADPGDWLMIRRDYRASNYSPLSQITPDNVKDLRLQWMWAMNEGGGNQPAPLVHNGIIYLNNAGNVMQALDGRTGDLIWENRYGSNANAAAMRGIAIHGDKLFAATSEAHLIALDARTGKTVWQTTIGDRSKGSYGTSRGPIVAKGKLIQGLGGCP